MTYYVAETDANGSVNSPALWQPTAAATLAGAKRAASRMRTFQGTSLHVGVCTDPCRFITVAVRRADAINMSRNGAWRDV